MKRFVLISFVLLSICSVVSALPRLHVEPEALPGDPVRVILFDEQPLTSITARLENEEGVVIVQNPGFYMPVTEDGEGESAHGIWISLLGIPSTASAGEYLLHVAGKSESEPFILSTPVTILNRPFRKEDIPLSTPMSELRTSDDPKKFEETKEMSELLRTFDNRALYHTEAFSPPLIEAVVSSFFGDRRTFLYSDGTKANAIHFGIDLVKPAGTEVTACGRGKVVFAGKRIITGETIVIEHLPGVYSLYYHLRQCTVSEADMVDRGDVIGTVGSTGLVTGAHLHWEIRIGGIPVSPNYFVAHKLLDKEEISTIMGMVQKKLEHE